MISKKPKPWDWYESEGYAKITIGQTAVKSQIYGNDKYTEMLW